MHVEAPAAETEPAVQAPTVASSPGSHAAPTDADDITEFVPAHTNVIGARDTLDRLPDRKAAAAVRDQVLDVIEAEGPIELGRLARIVARRFGLSTVRSARVEDIVRLVPRAQVRKSRKLGDFRVAGNTRSGHLGRLPIRRAEDGSRTLDEIAPEEIANAMLAVPTNTGT